MRWKGGPKRVARLCRPSPHGRGNENVPPLLSTPFCPTVPTYLLRTFYAPLRDQTPFFEHANCLFPFFPPPFEGAGLNRLLLLLLFRHGLGWHGAIKRKGEKEGGSKEEFQQPAAEARKGGQTRTRRPRGTFTKASEGW